jgi:hypothetical protein
VQLVSFNINIFPLSKKEINYRPRVTNGAQKSVHVGGICHRRTYFAGVGGVQIPPVHQRICVPRGYGSGVWVGQVRASPKIEPTLPPAPLHPTPDRLFSFRKNKK